MILVSVPFQTKSDELVILNWPDYMPEKILADFEKETGIKVSEVFFESDETKDTLLNASNKANGFHYDIVVSSEFRLQSYIKRDWVEKLDETQLPNIKHIDPKWRDINKNTAQYCMPYFWGTVGILYRKDKIREPIKSWHDFFRLSAKYSGKVKMINDSRDAFAVALKSKGFPINPTDSNHIRIASLILERQLPHVSSYGALELSENSQLLKGEVFMAMAYNGDALTLKDYSDNLEFVMPSDGTSLWLDCMSVTKLSLNKSNAHKFLNYINRPEVAAYLAETLYFASPNLAAEKHLSQAFLSNTLINPFPHQVSSSEFQKKLPHRIEKLLHSSFVQLRYQIDKRREK